MWFSFLVPSLEGWLKAGVGDGRRLKAKFFDFLSPLPTPKSPPRRGLAAIVALFFVVTALTTVGADPKKPSPGDDGLSFVRPSLGRVASPYGRRYGRFHSGLDIDDSRGRDVRASESGKVTFSGRKGDYGWTVIINHGHGWKTLYGHNYKNYAKVGDRVTQGQKIAKMGASGKATGRHVHFEVRYKGKTVDPMRVLGK